jgi:membrane protease YdiL (CAAX protease family)
LTQRLRAAGWSIGFLGGGYLLGLLLLLLVGELLPPLDPGSLLATAIEAAALLTGYGVLSWVIGVKLLRLGAADFFGASSQRGHALRSLGWSSLAGAGLAALAMVVAVPLGHAAWRSDGGTVPQWLGMLLPTGAVMLPAAFAEELAFRGLPLIMLSRAFGRVPSLVALAALFSFAHSDNPGVSTLALVNLALAGILLGVAFFTPGRLWSSTGVHLGWNLALAGLAAPVSGIALPMPWLDYSPGAPTWLTGGGFGPEGGAIASLCILGGAYLITRRTRAEGKA